MRVKKQPLVRLNKDVEDVLVEAVTQESLFESGVLEKESDVQDNKSYAIASNYIPAPSEGNKYLHYVNSLPYLTAEEEHSLALSWHEHKDLEAAKKLVLAHLRAVVKVARDYNGYGIPQEDLIQEGNVGLMKAVKGFNPHVGVRLISYALLWIRAEIQEYILSNWRLVKIGSSKNLKKLFFNLRSLQEQLWGASPLEQKEKIAELLDIPIHDVETAWQWFSAEPLSLESGEDSDDSSYDGRGAMGALQLPDAQTPLSILEQKEEDVLLPTLVQSALHALEPRERAILEARYLSEEKESLSELAKKWSISMERVRQIEVGALRKMRNVLESDRQVLVDYVTQKAPVGAKKKR